MKLKNHYQFRDIVKSLLFLHAVWEDKEPLEAFWLRWISDSDSPSSGLLMYLAVFKPLLSGPTNSSQAARFLFQFLNETGDLICAWTNPGFLNMA